MKTTARRKINTKINAESEMQQSNKILHMMEFPIIQNEERDFKCTRRRIALWHCTRVFRMKFSQRNPPSPKGIDPRVSYILEISKSVKNCASTRQNKVT